MDPIQETGAARHAAGAALVHDYKSGESRIRRWNVGDVKITSIMESAERIPWAPLFPAETSELYKKYDWLVPRFITPQGQIILAVQAFVLEVGSRRIVVDTCVGNDKPREIEHCTDLQTAFLEDLTAAGFPPETIDTVLCTHLHFDHVGWNTRLVNGRWVPTFPKARYLFGRREWEFCQDLLREKAVDVRHILDSVQPILDAGLADLVETNHRLTDELWLEPTHGHTPGHVSVHIASQGQEAVITGDVFHNPIQFAEPEICSVGCVDKDMSRKTRREFLSRYENKPVRLFAVHFNDPVGRIVREARNWRFSAE
ncbi:MAG: MBL fold metallo-hydrolase [Candidatus Acidiferrales bacterium]|jgi:glyoxylase-like metal-dependent hydrolase (beta-lactamase superfamily II)